MTDTSTTVDPAAQGGGQQTTQASWFEGIAGEDLGYLQNRGLDKMGAREAFLATAKAHREAEKLIGAPADKLIRLPKDAADAEGWSTLYSRLGVPSDEKGYDFTGIKFADGTELDPGFTSEIAKSLRAAGVAKDKAGDIVKAIVALGEREETEDAAANAQRQATERDALNIQWGSRAKANLIIAKNAAAALGVKPEEVGALEKVVGYARVMEMFRSIGSKIGEDQFVTNPLPQGGGSQVMTRDMAQATLNQRLADTVWGQKLEAGDTATAREFDNLTRMIAGGV